MFRNLLRVCVTLLPFYVAGSLEAQTLPINVYSQRNTQWSGHRMGASGLTVGNYGCMMTALASAYRVTPATLNSYLSRNGGYTSTGLLVHAVAANFDGSGGLKYINAGSLPTTATAIGRGIERGGVYIAESSRPLGGGTHWVLVYRVSGNNAFYMDPWDGTIRQVGAVESNGRVWVRFGANARIYSFN